MPTYHITGTVYYADGFDLTIEAESEHHARKLVDHQVACEENGYRFDPQLQEICVECVELVDGE